VKQAETSKLPIYYRSQIEGEFWAKFPCHVPKKIRTMPSFEHVAKEFLRSREQFKRSSFKLEFLGNAVLAVLEDKTWYVILTLDVAGGPKTVLSTTKDLLKVLKLAALMDNKWGGFGELRTLNTTVDELIKEYWPFNIAKGTPHAVRARVAISILKEEARS
jgi:hypothetical protein